MTASLQHDISAVQQIAVVPQILEVVCRTTGMGFAAVARVTDDRWVCCSVRDEIAFGLGPGGELEVETTICNEIRQSRQAVLIDHVACNPAFQNHHTPAKYGFQSYVSVPIVLEDGSFFGTLCAIDPRPAMVEGPAVKGMFELFANQIAYHLDAQRRVKASEAALRGAMDTGKLRDQFIAVLGHDLRNPLQSLKVAATVIEKAPDRAPALVPMMQRSIDRMSGLLEDVTDFAQAQLGDGINVRAEVTAIDADLLQVVEEGRSASPPRAIDYHSHLAEPVLVDRRRIAQLLSNLLGNAIKYGDLEAPVVVEARSDASGFVLQVTNRGPEIPADVKERLFEPFTRGESHLRQQGLGLGLYIVAQIAAAHGGTLEVDSSGGVTRFRFSMKNPGRR